MIRVHQGQCGLCVHFAEHQPQEQQKVMPIRKTQEAPEDLVEECGHPEHRTLHLMVTPMSGCAGFEQAVPPM
jgi:hypothetical protein